VGVTNQPMHGIAFVQKLVFVVENKRIFQVRARWFEISSSGVNYATSVR